MHSAAPAGCVYTFIRELAVLTARWIIAAGCLLGSLLFVVPADAGMNTACYQANSTQPSGASAHGFNCLRLYENWRTSAGIDTNDTRASGFRWYTHNSSTQAPDGPPWTTIQPTPSGDWSWQQGQVTLNPVSGTPYAGLTIMLMSCAQTGTTQNLTGTVYGPSFFVDVNAPSIATGSGGSIDAVAWNVAAFWLNGGPGASGVLMEPDIFEGPFGFFIHEWTVTAGSPTDVRFTSGLGITSPVTYGQLAVPAALNDGVHSLVGYYTNDSPVATGQCSAAAGAAAVCNGSTTNTLPSNPNGTYTSIDSTSYCLALSGGVGNPLVVGEIQVWTR